MQSIYCVQTYWRQGRRMEPGQLRQFAGEADARQVGKSLAVRMPGVLVYAITGEPEADFWDEPRLIARYGDAPSAA